eukprot:727835-Pelagomonas_calceolata.AAC.2
MHNASAQEQPAQVQRGAAVLHILCGLYIKRCVANCVQRGRNEATRHKMKLLGSLQGWAIKQAQQTNLFLRS